MTSYASLAAIAARSIKGGADVPTHVIEAISDPLSTLGADVPADVRAVLRDRALAVLQPAPEPEPEPEPVPATFGQAPFGAASFGGGVVRTSSPMDDWIQWPHDVRCLLRWADSAAVDWDGASIPYRASDSVFPFSGVVDASGRSPCDLAAGASWIHERWASQAEAAINEGRPKPPWPLEPLISWRLAQPFAGEPDTGKHRLIPEGLFAGQPMTVYVKRERRPDSVLPLLGLQPEPSDLQLPLPMPEAHGKRRRKNAKAPIPLQIAKAMGVAELQPGIGARVDKRLLVFGLLSLTRERRIPGYTQAWEPTLYELACVLWPDGRGGTNYRPDRHFRRLIAAMDALVAAKVAGPDGRMWRPIVPIADPIPTDPHSRARFALTLPDGCGSGPRIEYQPLVDAGTISDPAFDLELGLAYYWDESKRNRGHGGGRVYRTIPEFRRDASGVYVDATGKPLRDAKGRPVRSGYDSRAAIVRYVPNPDADAVPVLSPTDVWRLAYPSADPKRDRRRIAGERGKAMRRLRELESAGRIEVVEDGYGGVQVFEGRADADPRADLGNP